MSRARVASLVALGAFAIGCGPTPQYEVRVRLADPDAGAGIASTEVYVVRSCDAVTLGQPPPASAVITEQSFGTHRTAQALGEVPTGTIGIYGLARHELCWVMATGCETHEVRAGGSGLLDVTLRTPPPRFNCPGNQLCVSGECRDLPCPDFQVACHGVCVGADAGCP